MTQQIVGRSNNIKCYDKIRLTNLMTGQTLHACGFSSASSKNNAISCHKVQDDSDWFVPVKTDDPSSSYHFKYTDAIYLIHSQTSEHLHLFQEHESVISRKIEVSLTSSSKNQQQWVIECAEDSSRDQFWRVGEAITIKNKDSNLYLSSHKKRLRENDEYQVFGQSMKNDQVLGREKVSLDLLWRVTESVPFIIQYTPPILQKKNPKQTQEEEELKRLAKVSNQISKKSEQKNINEIGEIIKAENRRLEQVQLEARKIEQEDQKKKCWRKLCCCFCLDSEGYQKI